MVDTYSSESSCGLSSQNCRSYSLSMSTSSSKDSRYSASGSDMSLASASTCDSRACDHGLRDTLDSQAWSRGTSFDSLEPPMPRKKHSWQSVETSKHHCRQPWRGFSDLSSEACTEHPSRRYDERLPSSHGSSRTTSRGSYVPGSKNKLKTSPGCRGLAGPTRAKLANRGRGVEPQTERATPLHRDQALRCFADAPPRVRKSRRSAVPRVQPISVNHRAKADKVMPDGSDPWQTLLGENYIRVTSELGMIRQELREFRAAVSQCRPRVAAANKMRHESFLNVTSQTQRVIGGESARRHAMSQGMESLQELRCRAERLEELSSLHRESMLRTRKAAYFQQRLADFDRPLW
mmetsp:Transcript_40356/g.107042  ORF Transcript_40356/g.107042 Transcript_40356/m.107042 type:complete len:349 (-) Transcript_40356:106-1152(-)